MRLCISSVLYILTCLYGVSASNDVLTVMSRSFYIEHRMAIGFARLDLSKAPPKFNSLEEWERVKSTKMDTCARMVQHILSRDDAPDPIIKDGYICFPNLPPLPVGQLPSFLRKLLIYLDYVTLGPLLKNVRLRRLYLLLFVDAFQILTLYGIKFLYIDGQTSFNNRAKIVKRFREDPTYRVLIISSVGSTGLNLTVADTVIFLVSLS